MRLEGKRALITGAGSGIGRALAIEAARQGVAAILCGRSQQALEETRALIGDATAMEAEVHLMAADITHAAQRDDLHAEALHRFGRLDLLIHCAGVQWAGPVDRVGERELGQMLDTNLLAPMALTGAMLDLLKIAAPSRVVFVGSMFAEIPFPLFAGYSASKAGLRGFADAARRELQAQGIGVTLAEPRATATAMTARQPHLTSAFAMEMDAPEDVARRILRGVRRGQRTVYPGIAERVFAAIQALAPSLIDRALTRQLQQAIARLGPSWQSVQGPRLGVRCGRAASRPAAQEKEHSAL